MLALPIFPASHPASIVGANELNYCVRNGNRWTLIAINTNYSGYTLKTEHRKGRNMRKVACKREHCRRSSPRLISTGQLHVLPHFHLRPINDMVYVEPYSLSRWEILS